MGKIIGSMAYGSVILLTFELAGVAWHGSVLSIIAVLSATAIFSVLNVAS
ncbi:MAG: hypothetical protein Pg6C_11130 [Treponemataceae bacterium]|nr:MAG: hypothetical protein Pg6C_11130 [Treponemataceae bacterium]